MKIVTKTYIPNKKLYEKYIDKIYANEWGQVCLVSHLQESIA